MLYRIIKDYEKGERSINKEFIPESIPPESVWKELEDKVKSLTLKSLNLLPEILVNKIEYDAQKSITYVYANKLFTIKKNLIQVTPENILKLINMRRQDLITFWVYTLSVNRTPHIYNITETFTIYAGFNNNSKLRAKKTIINYISLINTQVNVLYLDKNDKVMRDLITYLKENYNFKTKKKVLFKIFETNEKLTRIKLLWKLNVFNGKEISKSKKYSETNILFELPKETIPQSSH